MTAVIYRNLTAEAQPEATELRQKYKQLLKNTPKSPFRF